MVSPCATVAAEDKFLLESSLLNDQYIELYLVSATGHTQWPFPLPSHHYQCPCPMQTGHNQALCHLPKWHSQSLCLLPTEHAQCRSPPHGTCQGPFCPGHRRCLSTRKIFSPAGNSNRSWNCWLNYDSDCHRFPGITEFL